MRNWNGAAVKQDRQFVSAVGLGEQREWCWGWNTEECLQSGISSSVFDANRFSSFIQCFYVRDWKVQWPNYFSIVLAWLQVTAISYRSKIIVANYVAVEIAHALSLWFESVAFSENSHSVLRAAAQKLSHRFSIILKQWDSGGKNQQQRRFRRKLFSSHISTTQTLEDLVQIASALYATSERNKYPLFLREAPQVSQCRNWQEWPKCSPEIQWWWLRAAKDVCP